MTGKCTVVALSALVLSGTQAALIGPYTPNSNTLHLWHLDDAGTPAADAAHYAYTGNYTTKPDANQPLNALFGTASLGNASHPLFGTALNVGANNSGLAALTPNNGTADNADHTFDNPATHAFTMEAIIKIGFNPATSIATPQEIIAGEGDAGDSSDRSWQFRIEANSTPSTTPWRLRFQKVSGYPATGGGNTGNYNLDANIPTGGDPNAIAQGEWYHVAVTFNGSWSTADNLKLYWTKLDPNNIVANQVASGQMNGWLREQDTDFALGNELRDFNGNTEGFFGMIDEVRISDLALGADQMQFVPEPASVMSIGLAGLMSIRRRRA